MRRDLKEKKIDLAQRTNRQHHVQHQTALTTKSATANTAPTLRLVHKNTQRLESETGAGNAMLTDCYMESWLFYQLKKHFDILKRKEDD